MLIKLPFKGIKMDNGGIHKKENEFLEAAYQYTLHVTFSNNKILGRKC